MVLAWGRGLPDDVRVGEPASAHRPRGWCRITGWWCCVCHGDCGGILRVCLTSIVQGLWPFETIGLRDKACWLCGDFSACWCGEVGVGGGCFIASLCVAP